MRSGDLDTLVRFLSPDPLVRTGRSRVPSGTSVAGERMAMFMPGVGGERVAGDQLVGHQPATFVVRRDSLTSAVEIDYSIAVVEGGAIVSRFAIKAVRAWPKDPRHALEFTAVSESVS